MTTAPSMLSPSANAPTAATSMSKFSSSNTLGWKPPRKTRGAFLHTASTTDHPAAANAARYSPNAIHSLPIFARSGTSAGTKNAAETRMERSSLRWRSFFAGAEPSAISTSSKCVME